jgi:hypothetical protein
VSGTRQYTHDKPRNAAASAAPATRIAADTTGFAEQSSAPGFSDAMLLPIVLSFLLVLEARVLPEQWRLHGTRKT